MKLYFSQDSKTCATADLERHLKIVSFYVKLLLRFMSNYPDDILYTTVFDVFLGLTRCIYTLEGKISNTTHEQLTYDFDNLLLALDNGDRLLMVNENANFALQYVN